jgi:hypothetical protein
MGGPAASVVVARDPDQGELVSRLKALSTDHSPANGTDGWIEISIATTTPIGGAYSGEGRPFEVRWARDGEMWADDEARSAHAKAIATAFGLHPSSTIYLAAGTNKSADHRILGELALYLAQIYDGVIDFDGALIPASTLSADEQADLTRMFEADWSEIAAPRERFFARLPGKILAVPYQTSNGRAWVTHVADREFMAAWLAHHDFHMIK